MFCDIADGLYPVLPEPNSVKQKKQISRNVSLEMLNIAFKLPGVFVDGEPEK